MYYVYNSKPSLNAISWPRGRAAWLQVSRAAHLPHRAGAEDAPGQRAPGGRGRQRAQEPGHVSHLRGRAPRSTHIGPVSGVFSRVQSSQEAKKGHAPCLFPWVRHGNDHRNRLAKAPPYLHLYVLSHCTACCLSIGDGVCSQGLLENPPGDSDNCKAKRLRQTRALATTKPAPAETKRKDGKERRGAEGQAFSS